MHCEIFCKLTYGEEEVDAQRNDNITNVWEEIISYLVSHHGIGREHLLLGIMLMISRSRSDNER